MTFLRSAMVAGFSLTVAGSVAAQPFPNQTSLNRACRADYYRFCPPYQGHRRALAECIRDHLGQASPVCRAELHQRIEILRAYAARNPRLRPSIEAELAQFGAAN